MSYLVMILVLCLGISLGLNASHYLPKKHRVVKSSAAEVDDTEAKKRRQRFEEEQKAFEQLMNYNSDVAYGVTEMR